jgi:hypothetical protein
VTMSNSADREISAPVRAQQRDEASAHEVLESGLCMDTTRFTAPVLTGHTSAGSYTGSPSALGC